MAACKTVTSGDDMERYFKRVDSPFLPASSAFLFLKKKHQHIVFIFLGTCPTTIPSLRMATALWIFNITPLTLAKQPFFNNYYRNPSILVDMVSSNATGDY